MQNRNASAGRSTRRKLTRRVVESLEPAPERYQVWDTELPGFGARVTPAGAKSYVLWYRKPGMGRAATPRMLTLGRHGQVTVDQARELAADALEAVRKGGDPARARASLRKRPTVDELVRMYLAWLRRRQKKLSSIADARRVLEQHVRPAIGRMAVADVRRRDVAAIAHRLEEAGHARTGGKVVQYCRAMFYRAELDEPPFHEMRAPGTNPCRRLEVNLGRKRRRRLSLDELARLGEALRAASHEGENPWLIGLVLLLLFTGARLREIMHARWAQVDLDAGVLRLEEHKTAQHAGEKVIHLSPPALAVLERLPRLGDNPYVIAGTRPRRPMVNPYPGLRRILERAGIEGLWFHDSRRTFASMGLGGGMSLEQIGALLGHASVQTTKGYSYLDDAPAREHTARIGASLEEILEKKPPAPSVSRDREPAQVRKRRA